MTSDKVRAMCIRHNYCTECDNEEYGNLLDRCQTVVDDNDILRIAECIMQYTDTEKLMWEFGSDETELLESICFNLINDCTYTTVELA